MAAPHAVVGVEGVNPDQAVTEGECRKTGQILPDSSTGDAKRPQFGTRFLTDPRQVFQHNAWDNVEWTEEQEAAAKKKVIENNQPLPAQKQEEYDNRANEYWNDFYTIHDNRFFKDRHWLFTEFPELSPQCCPNHESRPEVSSTDDNQQDSLDQESRPEVSSIDDNQQDSLDQESRPEVSSTDDNQQDSLDHESRPEVSSTDDNQQEDSVDHEPEVTCPPHNDGDFPGSPGTYRILEVGCGVGNTVFPILKTNNDPGLFVYCCDFSSTAVEIVKTNLDYDPGRCFAFVHDLSDVEANYPVPDGTLDVVVLIFVLSALHPDKMQASISRLAQLLRPGGVMLLRDYGRYDMAQLRFKKGRCLSENFYVRGDGTRVYFFTQDELHVMFSEAGLEKVQNLVDRRLQVNRGKQLTMYRVWIQCKYRKAFSQPPETQG